LGAPVPEAAVDEDREAGPGEGDVHSSSAETGDWPGDPVPKATYVQELTDQELWARVTPPLALHSYRYALRAR
jgi:hypothetical protein